MLTLPLTGTPITGLTVNDAIAPGRAAERPAMAMNTSEPLLFTSSSTLPGVLWAEATAMSKEIPNLFSISMAFSATGISLLLPIIMDTLDIAPTTALAIDNLAHGRTLRDGRSENCGRPMIRQRWFCKWFQEFPGSALEDDHEEYSDGDKRTDYDTDEVDDGVVDCLIQLYLAEGRDVAPPDEIGPDDTDQQTRDCHHATEGPAFSRAQDGRERSRHYHDDSESEDDQGHKCHEIHFSASVFLPAKRVNVTT